MGTTNKNYSRLTFKVCLINKNNGSQPYQYQSQVKQ